MSESRLSAAPMRLVLVALLAAAAAGQRTHLVQGPDLQTAILAAAPGDILLVSGVFSGPLSIRKPLHIHAQPGGASIFALVMEIASIPAGATLVLQGVNSTVARIHVHDCPGQVLLAGLSAPGIDITNCADVTVDQCSVGGGIVSRSSTALISRSVCSGVSGQRLLSTPGLLAEGGDVILTGSAITGGDAGGNPGSSGMVLVGANVRMSGDANRVVAGQSARVALDAVAGTGQLLYNPRSTFVPSGGGVPIDPRISVSLSRLPVTTINRTALGGIATLSIAGAANDVFVLLGVSPGPRLTIPGFEGELWTVPNALAQGALSASGTFSFSFPVPDVDVLRAVLFRWQAATFDGSVIRLGEPITESHY